VLGWLLGHPDEAYYLREIMKHTGAAHGAMQRELDTLTHAGLLRRTVRGKQVYFQANRESPIFPELYRLIIKTVGMVDVLREALTPITQHILLSFMFGSAARAELRSGSDIDLLVIGDVSFTAVANALTGAQERLGRDVNPTVYPPREFSTKIRKGHHFLTAVLSEPRLFVIGGADELGRLGAQRLADGTQNESKRGQGSSRRRRARSRR
jgi:predicted nucleotidyltransferase